MTVQGAGVDVRTALQRMDRRAFLPSTQVPFADSDRPLPIGWGQTNSQPSTVEKMLELLRVPPRALVLDVGAGSGWTTALLAYLVGSEGLVVGLERQEGLARWGEQNLATQRMPWASIEHSTPGQLGKPVPEGYDRILVSAAGSKLPARLIEQLAPGGRMVIPVQNTMLLVERAPYLLAGPEGEPSSPQDWGAQSDPLAPSTTLEQVRVTEHGSYMFVPLVD